MWKNQTRPVAPWSLGSPGPLDEEHHIRYMSQTQFQNLPPSLILSLLTVSPTTPKNLNDIVFDLEITVLCEIVYEFVRKL